jgi:GST-like protein
MIELHYSTTPNTWKIAIFLEEAEIAYRIRLWDMFAGEHLSREFHLLNPNHKLPVIVDENPADGGEPIVVFESAAILQYLADKTGKFMPTGIRERALVLQWLAWQIASVGPMFGQASHFTRYARVHEEYAITRFINESKRLLDVLDYRLEQSDYIAGAYSIADMAVWPWLNVVPDLLKIDLATYPSVDRWFAQIKARPAVQRVFEKKDTAIDARHIQQKPEMTDEEWSASFGEKMLAASKQR